MKSLENKYPPPFIALFFGLAKWGFSKIQPSIHIEPRLHITLTALFSVIAFFFGAGGIIAFRVAKTTINPIQIEQALHVVTSGIYRVTRNPMYLGLSALLLTWSIWLAVPQVLLGPMLFTIFIHRFQILPEERIMSAKFGKEYDDYRQHVRRWL